MRLLLHPLSSSPAPPWPSCRGLVYYVPPGILLPFSSLSILWLHPFVSPKGSASLGIVKGGPFPSKEWSYQLPREVLISSHTNSDSNMAGLSWCWRAPPLGDDGPELGEVLGQLGCWAIMAWKEASVLDLNLCSAAFCCVAWNHLLNLSEPFT